MNPNVTLTLTFWSKPSIWFSSSSRIRCTSLSAAAQSSRFAVRNLRNLKPQSRWAYLQSERRSALWRWRRSRQWRWWRERSPWPTERRLGPCGGLHPDTSERTRSPPRGWRQLRTEADSYSEKPAHAFLVEEQLEWAWPKSVSEESNFGSAVSNWVLFRVFVGEASSSEKDEFDTLTSVKFDIWDDVALSPGIWTLSRLSHRNAATKRGGEQRFHEDTHHQSCRLQGAKLWAWTPSKAGCGSVFVSAAAETFQTMNVENP